MITGLKSKEKISNTCYIWPCENAVMDALDQKPQTGPPAAARW